MKQHRHQIYTTANENKKKVYRLKYRKDRKILLYI